MTPKEQAAIQQALEALGRIHFAATELDRRNRVRWFDDAVNEAKEAITDLREALDHSGEADEMVVGWDRVKPEAIASDPLYQQGFVDGVEEGRNQIAEQAEQEPVAWMRLNEKGECENIEYIGNFDEHLYLPPSCQWLYAAPVRTKDLTDGEIRAIRFNWERNEFAIDFARAVIAADRRKNRG